MRGVIEQTYPNKNEDLSNPYIGNQCIDEANKVYILKMRMKKAFGKEKPDEHILPSLSDFTIHLTCTENKRS